ncbi:MAG: GTP-binding protein, partial [Proteobacteria bacterium]|nr:GTP-binding protein [Pseudomonadota bacterium]
NPAAPIHHAAHGDVEPSKLFGCGLYDPASKSFDVQNWLREEAYHGGHEEHDQGHDHHHLDKNRHGSDIEAFCMVYDEPLEWPAFIAWIQTLITHKGENLLRIKGIVSIVDEEKPIAIHGVQHVFHNPVRLPDWPSNDRRSRIVFITKGIEPGVIKQSLEALQKAAKATAG